MSTEGAYINVSRDEKTGRFNTNIDYKGDKRSFGITSESLQVNINTRIDSVIDYLKQIERIKKIKKLTR